MLISAPVAMDTLPISLPQSTLTPTTMAATAATPTTSDPSPSNTEDWEPSSDPIIVSHPAFRLACSYGSDGRNSLKEFLASVATLEKFSKQLNSVSIWDQRSSRCVIGICCFLASIEPNERRTGSVDIQGWIVGREDPFGR